MGQLQVFNVVKHYGDNLIVDRVSFTVEDGEFFVLLGPSGSGKSTLLKLICGLETADSGTIAVAGRDITNLPPRERNLGMVFQEYGLYPNMNVYKNISYGLETRGFRKEDIQHRITVASEKLGLDELLGRDVVDLSGGEQQRVALARAMVKDADLYLYDEPLSNLDPKLRHKARRDILAVHRIKERPSVYVTHDQVEAFAMADRIALLGNGQLQQVGTTDDLINHPTNLFVARFIGSPPINTLEGVMFSDDGGRNYGLTTDGFTINMSPRWKAILEQANLSGGRVVVGIRPDAIARPGYPAEFAMTSANEVKGKVELVEPLLGETIVTVQMGQSTSLITALRDDGADMLNVGDEVTLAIDVDRLILFNPETENAL